jgi:hypothetical protein
MYLVNAFEGHDEELRYGKYGTEGANDAEKL